MNTYAYLIKAKAKAEAKSLFCWLSAKSDSRAEREILNILEDNGIDVGRGADYNLPVRTNWHVVDDLPAEGVLDQTWCDRYQLAEDGVTWQAIPAAAPAPTPEEIPEQALAAEATKAPSAPLDDGLEHPVAQMSFRKKLLSQFISSESIHHVTVPQRIQIAEMELDQDNYYVQNLLLASENIADVKGFTTHQIWKLTEAVKQVFPTDTRPELGILIQFMNAWGKTEHIDRGVLVKKWLEGNRISAITPLMKAEPSAPTAEVTAPSETYRTDAGANAGGGIVTDRGSEIVHDKKSLSLDIALGVISRSMDFDIYNLEGGVYRRAKEIRDARPNYHDEYLAWLGKLNKCPGILDYSRAAIIALIKAAPDDLWRTSGALQGYINSTLIETNHANPSAETVAIACGTVKSDKEEIATNDLHAEGELVKVATGVFDASSLFTAATKTNMADAGQPAETAENVQMEENHGDETEADIEVQMGETADVSAECDADVNHPSDALNNDSGHQIEETTSEQLYTHLMVDLESMGDNPDAPIVSIGALFFDPETGRTGAEFYKVISLESAMAFGGIPDAGTILWWMRKSSEARSALLVEDAIPLDDALLQFNDYIGENAANGPDTVQVWGNGATFDNVLLSQSYKRTGITRPWKFWNDRDVRTIVELGKAIGINPRYEIPFEGELHNALDDARHQVKYVSKIWQVLTQI
jgi:exodeoxyribonuclease VIII